MKKSAGIAIILNGIKILLVHPTSSRWWGTYGIPKGGIDEGETVPEAASRETFEEVGIYIPTRFLKDQQYIMYKNDEKKVFYYVYHISDPSEIGLASEIVPKNMLQLKEVDWAGFVDFEEAKKRMNKWQLPIVKKL